MATMLLENRGKDDINLPQIDHVLKPGERVSLSAQVASHLPAIVLENYPGLVDVTDEASVAPEKPAAQEKPKDE